MRYPLRYYQTAAKEAIISSWRKRQIPYVSIMTGLGKSLSLADFSELSLIKGLRVLQLVPKKELCEQNYKELYQYIRHGDNRHLVSDVGICCAQLNKKQIHRQCVIAMTSSFVNCVNAAGHFDVVLIDECHHVNFTAQDDKTGGGYEKILTTIKAKNPKVLIAGFTATPYRLDQGYLHDESPKVRPFFTDLVYDTTPDIGKLIELGYLSPIDTINTNVKVNLSGVRMSGKDFNQSDAGLKFDAICGESVADMKRIFKEKDIRTAIIFASTVTNAEHILREWGDNSTMRLVTGETAKIEREEVFNWLKNGDGNRYLVNINVATEGFNFPALECVVLMRATTSPALMVQMIGRLLRPHEGKIGLLIDYGTNIERLGTIDNIRVKAPGGGGEMPVKYCTAEIDTLVTVEIDGEMVTKVPGEICDTPNLISAKKCKVCEAEFIALDDGGNYTMRTKAQALKAKYIKTYPVESMFFSITYDTDYMTKVLVINFMTAGFKSIYDMPVKTHNSNIFNDAKKIVIALLTNKSNFSKVCLTPEGIIEAAEKGWFYDVSEITVKTEGKYKQLVGWKFRQTQQQ